MKVKMDLDTESIQNQSNITAKISHEKISSYHVTLKREFVRGLGIDDGDKVDIAILKIHKNDGLPSVVSDVAATATSTPDTEKSNIALTDPQTPVQELSRQEGLQSMYRETPQETPAKKGGKRGNSKRGRKGGVKQAKHGKRAAHVRK